MTNTAVLGDNLAILSLRVAQQVDRKLHNKAFDPAAFSAFATELSRATGIDEAPSISFLQSNPIATDILAQAVSSQRPVSKIPELAEAVFSIVNASKDLDESKSREEFSRLKNFCLALHRSIMSQRLPASHHRDTAFEEALGILR